ncbi:MAG TPA: NUDIX domain-containing protein [Patescibacteria group bacterium]|nr:NUDIX domain-containing protein [Patescibacteria group bacterium]
MNEENIRVGIGVLILKDNKVLLTQRRGSHGAGEWAFPGGHLEYMESYEECARREVREEAGIEIKNVRFQLLANVKKYGNKHYVHIGLVADWKSGVPKQLEPDKSGEWFWFELYKLPKPLFEMCKLSFKSLATGQTYFDS